jgi:hypothetical protein
MGRHWWLPSPLAEPYTYPAITVDEEPCNCTPPELITVEDADAYMAETLKASQWDALTATQKAQALKSSQDALRTLRWCTEKETCCGKDLADSYAAAASELALVLFGNATAVFGASNQAPTPIIKREKFDVFEQEFFDPGPIALQVLPRDKRVGSRSPTVLRLYPWLLDLVGCWLDEPDQSLVAILRG